MQIPAIHGFMVGDADGISVSLPRRPSSIWPGVVCVLGFPDDFRKAVLLAVSHGGDSDITGAITGNVLGALLGTSSIPDPWLAELELRDEIEIFAADLYTRYREDDGG